MIVPGHDPSRDRDNPSNGFVPSVPSWDEAYVPNVPSLSRDISRLARGFGASRDYSAHQARAVYPLSRVRDCRPLPRRGRSCRVTNG